MLIPSDEPHPARTQNRDAADSCSAADSGDEPPAPPNPTAVVLDVTGTILDDEEHALPGAVDAVEEVRSSGAPIVLASNLSAKTSRQLHEELQLEGFSVPLESIVTTASLTADHLRAHHPSARVMLFAEGKPFSDDDGLNLVASDPDVVVLGGVGSWLDHGALNAIVGLAGEGVPLVAMHRNVCWQTADGLALDLGGLLPGIESASGSEPHVIGKPAKAFFERALACAGVGAVGAVMVGDDIRSDVLAAQELGLTGVLVRTGKYRGDTLPGCDRTPDFVIDSIQDLPGLLTGGE